MSMRRKLESALSYTHAFQPALHKAFPLSAELPDAMRAILAQLDGGRPSNRSPSSRLEALRQLAEREAAETNTCPCF